MKILVDADSCPREARELIVRRAAGLGIEAVFAANRAIPGIVTGNKTGKIRMEICPQLDGAADDRIAELAESGDVVISRDVPLAERLVGAGVAVLNDRGRVYTKENIGELLSLRNFTVGLAENGMGIERTANYGKKDFKKFADSLDRLLAKTLKSPGTGSASV